MLFLDKKSTYRVKNIFSKILEKVDKEQWACNLEYFVFLPFWIAALFFIVLGYWETHHLLKKNLLCELAD